MRHRAWAGLSSISSTFLHMLLLCTLRAWNDCLVKPINFLLGHNPFWPDKHLLSHISMNRMTIDFVNHLQDYRSKWTPLRPCLCMKKSCPRKEGHPLSWVNFSECLYYEKKVNPFARANLCCHMLRLLKTVLAHVILLRWPVWAIQSVHMEKSWPG